MAKKKSQQNPAPKRLILSRGEELVKIVPRKLTVIPPDPPRTYEEAIGVLVPQCSKALQTLRSIPKALKADEGLVMCLRLHPDMLAKTYEPAGIFREAKGLRQIGSRAWYPVLTEVKKTDRVERRLEKKERLESRIIFAQGSISAYESLLESLTSDPSKVNAAFINDICKLERLDLLSEKEVLNIPSGWKKGRAELVFHPTPGISPVEEDLLLDALDWCGIDLERACIRPYAGGPTFVSVNADAASLKKLAHCNFLRAARELRSIQVPNLRALATSVAPPAPVGREKSTILVGMFDGGVDTAVPQLRGFVTEEAALSVSSPSDPDYVAHGTAVAGAILYGSLDRHNATAPLPTPNVSVVSFRVLPQKDPHDNDLYEVIDLIEDVVPQRPDIQTFNVSLGPPGVIEDDYISRFTWVLDYLTQKHRVMFVNAVGNSGDLPLGDGRIQSPSDSVHSLSVGAYTLDAHHKPVRADYSSYGPGREGGKVKPEILLFGGCSNRPFHVLTSGGRRTCSTGTSLSTPVASQIHASIRGQFPQAQPLLAKVLMIHNANHPAKRHCSELGFGFLSGELPDLFSCTDNEVTILYQKSLPTSKHHRLQIPLPEGVQLPGRSYIRFTLGVLAPVSMSHPGDYTGACIVDQFCPNWLIHTLNPPSTMKANPRRLHIEKDAEEIRLLVASGWKLSQLPVSKQQALTEQQQRNKDLKWDTVVKREWSCQTEGALYQPSIILHAMHRRDAASEVEYAAAVTISCRGFAGSLYSLICARFPQLIPVQLRAAAELRISIS